MIVSYDGREYAGEVLSLGANEVQVSVMHRKFCGFWKWPEPKDVHNFLWKMLSGRQPHQCLLVQEDNFVSMISSEYVTDHFTMFIFHIY